MSTQVFSHLVYGSLLLGALAACAPLQTQHQQGTAIGTGVGAAAGALLGQAIGKNTDSTLVGAGVGALVGGLAGSQVGRYLDYQEQELRSAIAASEAASVARNRDVLTATFQGATFFHHDSAVLLPQGQREVARVAGVLNRYPETRIEVRGHSDATGAHGCNQQLSRERAEAVADGLVQHGVPRHRISVVGYGERQPVSSSHAMNRRVEIVVIPAG